MNYKGLVVVPPGVPPLAAGASHAAQRIANRPIVCHVVEALVRAGINDLALAGPAASLDELRQCMREELSPGIGITFLPQKGRADLLGGLRAAKDFVNDDPVVVHYADGLLGQQLDWLFEERDEHALPDLLLLLHRRESSRSGLTPAAQRLLGLTELNGHGARLAVAGVCAFGPAALAAAVRMSDSVDRVDLMSIAEHLASTSRNLEAQVVRSWRRYRGDPIDLLELNRLILDQLVVPTDIIDSGDNRIEGRVVIHSTASVKSSIILGPCVIGAHSRVSDSYIGPYTSIGANAEIEGAEIVGSIVADDVSITHVGGRIEGSTIGRNACIFRDFALPRAMRLHVGEGVQVALN